MSFLLNSSQTSKTSSHVSTIASSDFALSSMSGRQLVFESQQIPNTIPGPDITVPTSHTAPPTDGTLVVTCCACGSGPALAEIAPQCVSCSHCWQTCPTCTIQKV